MIAVIGSNNMDLISYVQRMPEPGETLAMKDFSRMAGKVPTKLWLLHAWERIF